ncbi:MAG: InlB B-repeat-containing protein [Bacilli bacterium]
MKKRRIPLVFCSLMLIGGLSACLPANPPSSVPSNEQSSSIVVNSYLVSFYVDGVLYRTAQVKEGETVTNIIDNPTKEGYDFSGWKLEDNTEFNLETTLVTSNLTVNATFTKKVVVEPGKDEITLNVEDTKDPTKEYSIVIGWYGKTATSGLNVDVMKVFANNLVKYLKAKGVSDEDIKKVSIRRYGDENTAVAPMGELINADGDCDLLLGVGKNITSTGLVEVVEKQEGIVMGGISRYIARVTDTKQIVKDLYDFIISANEANSMFLDTFVVPTNA